MKRIFLKLNMAVIFLVVLFAGVSYAKDYTVTLKIGEGYTISIEYEKQNTFTFTYEGAYMIAYSGEPFFTSDVTSQFTNGNKTYCYLEAGEKYTTNPNIIDHGYYTHYAKIKRISKTEYDAMYQKIINKEMEEEASGLEEIVSRVFIGIGDFLMARIRDIFGDSLSIDTLIFNQYEPTKLTFYSGTTGTEGVSSVLIRNTNYWYNVFLTFTFIVYIIILVYTGIMILVSVGTPQQAKAMNYFGNWVLGLVILAFVPYYGFPVLFRLNDALVSYIGKDHASFETYYNVYSKYMGNERLGGDSYTVLVERIEGLMEESEENRLEAYEAARDNLQDVENDLTERAIAGVERDNTITEAMVERAEESVRYSLENIYEYYERLRKNGQDETFRTKEGTQQWILTNIKEGIDAYRNDIENDTTSEGESTSREDLYILQVREQFYQILCDPQNKLLEELYDNLETYYQEGVNLEQYAGDLEIVENDIMGSMRAMAGKTKRFVFVIIWFMLLFQMLGLLILYYKRIFIIAILIAIFPIIMLFYCIDKLADGKSQTLSMWMKEFLANIFIQSIHAVIYVVLVDLGLKIYTETSHQNWIFLVTAMLFILPAEALMKEIFDLNGISLRKVGGMATKVAMGIGALTNLVTARRGSRDKSIKEGNDKRNAAIQKKQNRADTKYTRREYRDQRYSAAAREMTGAKGVVARAGAGAYHLGTQMRNGVYQAATATRKGIAAAAPTLTSGIRHAKNVAGITAAAVYGLSEGSMEGFYGAAKAASSITGKTKNADKKPDVKRSLEAAYWRKGKKK